VLISDTNKFIFIHVPKTAGTSMRVVLQPYATIPQKSANHKYAQVSTAFRNDHLGAQEITERIRPQVWDTCYKFAFVRNPWALMLSHCLYFRQTESSSELHVRAKTDDFNSYIAWYFSRSVAEAKFVNGFSEFIELDGLPALDYVGKLEKVREDFPTVLAKIGVANAVLPLKNATAHTAYKDYYNDTAKKIVEKTFEKHLHVFEYRF